MAALYKQCSKMVRIQPGDEIVEKSFLKIQIKYIVKIESLQIINKSIESGLVFWAIPNSIERHHIHDKVIYVNLPKNERLFDFQPHHLFHVLILTNQKLIKAFAKSHCVIFIAQRTCVYFHQLTSRQNNDGLAVLLEKYKVRF